MGGQRITAKLVQKWRALYTSRPFALVRRLFHRFRCPYPLTASYHITQRSSAKGNGGQRDLVLTRATVWYIGIVLSEYHIYAGD